ncbi:ABC transporter substrate-binding protein [Haloplasma contractile]|uniref:ABC transporter substrate binding protein Proline-glycine betaine n=1 Tax=Haloplasma contractile SSD-17B TaxID=1033810 RepID=U2FJY6_9MOLU|nr:ABC transporter substrate-binding protein [Haloplasma contractile]ERJ13130.1 ABC transporter substrate binding protein Proline-glycine betaine [Haloplasma contractile SSD-17B]
MKKHLSKILSIVAAFAIMFTLAACGEQEEKIVIGEGDWDSAAFHDQVTKFIIEEGYGVQVEIKLADTAVQNASLKTGDIDLVTEWWVDNIPSYNEDIEAGEYTSVSTNFDDNEQGIYVPTYMVEGDDAIAPNLKTVQDLKDYAHLFPNPEGGDKGIIYGGPEGWSATAFLHNKMEAYGLNEYYTFRTIDSSATLSATLASAYEKGEPWVGYNWKPTWVMGLYDMTLLEDTPYNEEDFKQGKGAFSTSDVNVVITDGFEERFPEVTEFLSNYETSADITSQALAYMRENDVEADAAAKWFLENKQDVWSDWVPTDVKDKILEALDNE